MGYQYAYLVGIVTTIAPLWLFLFWWRKDLIREMLLMSVLFGIAGPISELWYLKDYWRPETITGWPISFEDFLFGFFIGGIASVAYEVFFRKHFYARKKKFSPYRTTAATTGVAALSLQYFTDLNSIYVSLILFLLFAIGMLIFRRDLLVDGIVSGFLMASIMFAAYFVFLNLFPEAIDRWWVIENISAVYIWKVPIEELLWAFGLGLVAGPLYEFLTGKVFKRRVSFT